MSVKKSEKFIYLQNKAQHYDKLRHMKPSFRYSAPKSQKHKP